MSGKHCDTCNILKLRYDDLLRRYEKLSLKQPENQSSECYDVGDIIEGFRIRKYKVKANEKVYWKYYADMFNKGRQNRVYIGNRLDKKIVQGKIKAFKKKHDF